jgi:hypothetical protein
MEKVSNVLAHVFFFPNNDEGIHLDKSENWYFGEPNTPDGQTKFYTVLLHEIGHRYIRC